MNYILSAAVFFTLLCTISHDAYAMLVDGSKALTQSPNRLSDRRAQQRAFAYAAHNTPPTTTSDADLAPAGTAQEQCIIALEHEMRKLQEQNKKLISERNEAWFELTLIAQKYHRIQHIIDNPTSYRLRTKRPEAKEIP